ncbi:ubiquitin carboxyl-terminal hydrolase CYLD [Elysia marginata]|uniref:ubiquitinyl hydrolase 1 n=1 Tax=Elysia marginata TaxID=1093978 RepID=A0AAV4FP36_9GAST|nr:ubiquitin carboxyl-terminal hydrolase CYLD [Elysia marginata]
MNDSRDGHYFILLRRKHGRRRANNSQASARVKNTEKNRTPTESQPHLEVLAGSLLLLVEEINNYGRIEYELETLDEASEGEPDTAVRVTCIPGEDVYRLKLQEIQLLRPIPTCKERLEVYNDASWLIDGRQLRVGDSVFVKLKGEQSEIRGILRFKGAEVQDSKGILFGVELEEGKGTCDGKFRGIQYFKTSPDHAVFVALHKLRRSKDGWQAQTRMRADADGDNFLKATNAHGNAPVVVGERIVWMSDDGPEKGVVKWVGCLPGDISSNTTVGVEFDRKVGSGTGKFRDKRLFFAKQGHASLIPLMGLMKEAEFDGASAFPLDFGLPQEQDHQDALFREMFTDLPKSSYPSPYQNSPGSSDLNFSGSNIRSYGTRSASSTGKMMAAAPGLPDVGAGAASAALGYVSPQLAQQQQQLQQENQQLPQYQDMLLAQQFSKLSSDPYLASRGVAGVAASSGTNPLYEHSRMLEKSAAQPSPLTTWSAAKPAVKPSQVPDPDLGVGSLVQVQLKYPIYGIIRWIGVTDDQSGKKTAGLELEEEMSAATDGVYIGRRYFTCPPKRGLFVPLHRCSKDKRYNFSTNVNKLPNDFGGQLTPDIPGDITPPEVLTQGDLNTICGKNRGIQGHHNSCYLDATLFCMFYFTTVFDAIFNRPANAEDLQEYPEVQRVLKEGIVNPLRKFNYVRADKVLKLRELLDKLGTVPGMMGEEKDPEEFLNALLTQIMKADPILQLSSGQHAYFYQLFIEEDEKLLLPTTQKLVELSFLQGNVKLKEVPPCLMIQMPRFGKDYKMFHRIVPSLELDITHIVENCPRDCIVCGGLATYECKDCYQVHGPGLNTTAFCEPCVNKSHKHMSRRSHQPKPITTNKEFLEHYEKLKSQHRQQQHLLADERNGGLGDDADNIPLPRETMELFAVICIQTSHYVSFVKCGLGRDAPWVFFDSMADRMGEQGGYNIPEVVHVPKFAEWLDKSFMRELHSNTDDKDLPEHLRRVLCDGYMCMYQSPTVMMYQ